MAVVCHDNALYGAFGRNKGGENTATEIAQGSRPCVAKIQTRVLSRATAGATRMPSGPRRFRNRDLRPQVEARLGRPYSPGQMTYDLRRLRLKVLIYQVPDTHRYTATTYGLKVAFFFSKLYPTTRPPLLPEKLARPSLARPEGPGSLYS